MQHHGQRGAVLERGDHLVDRTRQAGQLEATGHLAQCVGERRSGPHREHHPTEFDGEFA